MANKALSGPPRNSDPAIGGAAVTPHDTNSVRTGGSAGRALWIGGAGAGALKVTTADGSVLAFAGVPVGFFPIAATIVWSTGTDVTSILMVW